MRTFPVPRRVFIGLRHSGINMDRTEDFIQAELMTHRRHEFGDEITRMFPDDGGA